MGKFSWRFKPFANDGLAHRFFDDPTRSRIKRVTNWSVALIFGYQK